MAGTSKKPAAPGRRGASRRVTNLSAPKGKGVKGGSTLRDRQNQFDKATKDGVVTGSEYNK